MTVTVDDLALDWLGYATLRIEGPDGTVVYFDPGRYGTLTGEWEPDTPGVGHPEAQDYRAEDADLVCVTHDHHYETDGIQRVSNDDTTIAVYEAIHPPGIDREDGDLSDLPGEVVRVGEEDDRVLADVVVRTVPAYNLPDGPNVDDEGEPVHPKGIGVGYLVTVDDTTVFWPGDSDVLPGHEELDVDVFTPSISQSFTMDRHSAADLAEQLKPDLVLPIHYNTFAALEADDEAFAVDVATRGIPVALDR